MNLRKLYQWVKQTSKHWEGVSRHFRANVEVFSRGVVRAQSSHLRKIAGVSGGRADSQRRRLRRFVATPQPMNSFFQHWTRSVVETLKQRHTNSRPDYPREGQAHMIIRLLKQVKAGLPPGTQVRVLADRGIGTSPLLMRGIMALERTFLFRVTKQSKIIFPSGETVCFYDQVTAPGHMYHASGRVFKKRGRIPAQVRVLWGHHAQDRWALVTNAPLVGGEYAQRM
jgi:hypothetical protein